MHDLGKLGLSEKQYAVYTTMLQLGRASISTIAKDAHLKRPTVYLVMDELRELGLILEAVSGKQKWYSPVHPKKILELAEKQCEIIENKLPDLLTIYNVPLEKPKIQVFEGMAATKEIYKEIFREIDNKEEALWISRIDDFQQNAQEIVQLYKKTISSIQNPRVRELNYGNEEGIKWAKSFSHLQSKTFRTQLLPLQYELGRTEHLILKNKIVMFTYSDTIFVTIIESSELAKTYRTMFEVLWEKSLPLDQFLRHNKKK